MNLYRLWYDSLPQKFTLLILRNFIPAKIEFPNFEIASKLALLAFKDLAALAEPPKPLHSRLHRIKLQITLRSRIETPAKRFFCKMKLRKKSRVDTYQA